MHWCHALRSAYHEDIIPVDIVVEKKNLLHVETGPGSFLKYQLFRAHYQSHSVTLTCVDRDSYQSRLGLTTL